MAKLIFEHGFSDRDADEANARGYLAGTMVEVRNGRRYAVVFYDHVRLSQDLEEGCRFGRSFVADPGMIVLQAITPESMQAAVDILEEGGFFESLLPVNK